MDLLFGVSNDTLYMYTMSCTVYSMYIAVNMYMYIIYTTLSLSLSLSHTHTHTHTHRYHRVETNGKQHYAIMGYTTVYSFYAYPDKTRARISQMLILPPYQRKGHGGLYLIVLLIQYTPLNSD